MPVFILDAARKPLSPCHPAVARKLLASGKAAVLRRCPFTLILRRVVQEGHAELLRLKVDPGSRITGIAVVNDRTGQVVFAAEVEHRGAQIHAALDTRRALRRSRRRRKTRYRVPRFANRRRQDGWLPPSLESRIANIETWVGRLRRLTPIGALSVELIKFDPQSMEHPEARGVTYQRGELAGYEVRKYLLEKWDRTCAYCGAKRVPLQVEHLRPRRRGGTDRVANLTLACADCNQAKGDQLLEEFLAGRPEVLDRLQAQARAPLKDATAVNAIRWKLFRRLADTGLPLEAGTGGRTTFNRRRQGLPKTHWIDAACVGASTPAALCLAGVRLLLVKATGRGVRRICITDRFGFPSKHRLRQKEFFGYRTGDLVRAVIPSGRNAGRYIGRVTVRSRPCFRLLGFEIHPKHLVRLQKTDGYHYATEAALLPGSGAQGLSAEVKEICQQ